MRKLLAICTLFLCLQAAAQDTLSPLHYNPRLYHPHAKRYHTVTDDRHKNLVIVENIAQSSIILTQSDTLSLPFIDDFTYPSLRPYDYSGIYDSVINAIGPCDTMWTMGLVTDTLSFVQTYSYTFDTATQTMDSTPKAPIKFFNTFGFTGNCFTMGDTAYLFPLDSFPYFDSTSGLLTYQVPDSNNLVTITYAPVLYLDSAPAYTKWLDNNAYQNYTSGYLPPSLGVVTFDGTGSDGQPYDDTVSSSWGIADVLTSKPLYMSSYTDADSVYLSFYYQPGGFGVFAEDAVVGDSLVLEFYNGYTNNWDEIWSITGDSIPPDTSDAFRQVILRIPSTNLSTNTLYFFDGFQFRFLNYGSLAGINSVWNLDYVRLAPNRTFTDTAISDLTFQYQFPSILKNFSEMPAEQYTGKADLADSIQLFSANLNIPQATGTNPPAVNWTAFANQVYPSAAVVMAPATNTFNADTETVVLLFPHTQDTITAPPPPLPFDSVVVNSQAILDVNDVLPANDTISHNQVLSNVLAYDDGTAELAYGLQNLGTNKFAYDFTLNAPDSLVGYQILYTNVNAPVQDLVFNFNLWYTIDTQNVFWADTPVYTSNNDIPLYIDSVNGFTTYTLVPPVPLPTHFYFGWAQTDVRNLQIGYDLNSTKGRPHMYIYSSTTGVWQLSTISTDGSPMIRLLLGHSYQVASGIKTVAANTIKVYPNPTSGQLTFELPPDGDHYVVEVFNMLGQMGLSQTISAGANTINLSNLDQGVYTVRITDTSTGMSYLNKIVRSAKD